MGQREGWQPADPEALVLPRQHVVRQVDLLVDHGELDLRVLAGHHLEEEGARRHAGLSSEHVYRTASCRPQQSLEQRYVLINTANVKTPGGGSREEH